MATESFKCLVLGTPDRLFTNIKDLRNLGNASLVFKEQPQDEFLPLCQQVHRRNLVQGSRLDFRFMSRVFRVVEILEWSGCQCLSAERIDGHAAGDEGNPGRECCSFRVIVEQHATVISQEFQVDSLDKVLDIGRGGIFELRTSRPPDRGEDEACRLLYKLFPGFSIPRSAGFQIDIHGVDVLEVSILGLGRRSLNPVGMPDGTRP